ncbi:MAG TPA: LamG domain-containing protein [Planctomycetota bacterium]|nr:LamG domain-containing protein [Planctomycetota bacterium]
MRSPIPAPLSIWPFAALLTAIPAQNVGVAFDAMVDGYIEVPYTAQVVPQSGLTIEAWITYDDATLGTGYRYPTIVRQGLSVGGSEDYFLRVNADNVGARVLRWKVVPAGSTSGSGIIVNWTFTAGQLATWTHVAATYDGLSSKLYVNGMLVGSANSNGMPIRDVGNEVFRIGKGSDIGTPIEVWNGEIDEVRLWPFARTQTEIQATMNQELLGVPGLVSTWNLSGFLFDTSGGGLNATSSGQVTFTANTLSLASPSMPIASGASTPGCLGDLLLSPTSAAQVGNTGFGIECTRTPAGAIALWGASAQALASPFPLLGVGVWVDPLGVITVTGLADGLGALRVGVPVGATVPPGFTFAAQAFVLDACGSQLFTASNALTVVVQP